MSRPLMRPSGANRTMLACVRLACAMLACAMLACAMLACSSGGTRVDLRIRLAASDSVCSVEDSGSLDGDILLRICGSETGTCISLDGESEYLRLPIDSFESAPIDIADPGETARVEVQVCQGDSVIAFGSAEQARLSDGLDIVLHRTQRTSCGETVSPRAFGEAVVLPNGEVLLFGGVNLDLSGTQGEAGPMVETVEVYDPVSDQVRAVSGSFTGALGVPVLLASDGNKHRIRVFGSLFADAESAAFQLNRTTAARAGFFGLPVQPTTETRFASVQDLVYDASSKTLTSELIPGVEATGFSAGAGDVVAFGVGDTGLPRGGGVRVKDIDTFQLFETKTQRLGHTVTETGDGSMLIWGGPILEQLGDVQTVAGELLKVTTLTTVNVGAPVGEVPTAFHAAGSLISGEVIVAGGLQSICVGDCQLKVSQIYAAQPLRVMAIDGTRKPVGGVNIEPAIFQAAVRVGRSWIVTGGTGATDGEEGKLFSYQPNAQVTVVTQEGGEYSARPFTPLRAPRFGHTMVSLENGKAIVFGGVEPAGDGLIASGTVEWVVAEPTENLCAL